MKHAPGPREHPPDQGEVSERRRVWEALLPLSLFAAVAACFKIRSYDVFWHLVAGRWILEHQRLPNPDPLRFTAEGHEWIDHEWLFQLLLATIEAVGGLPALALFRIVATVACALLLWAACRRAGAGPTAAAAWAGLAIFLARPRLFLRPELLTLVLLSLFLWLLLRYRVQPRGSTALALVGLTLIWANAHPAVLMAPVLAAAFLVASRWSQSGSHRWSQAIGLPATLLLTTLINPSGYHLWWVPVEISGALAELPGTNPEWLPQWKQPLAGYWLLVVTSVVLTSWVWRRTRRIDLGTAAVALALACLGATSVRQLAPFAIGAVLHLARTLAWLDRPPLAIRYQRALLWCLALVGLAYLHFPPQDGPLRPRQGRYASGLGLLENRYPEAAADFVVAHPEIGRLYNNVAYGGYLLWRLYPPRQVFNDGRNELNPGFLREIADARSDGRKWHQLFARYQLVGALVRYDERRRPVVDLATDQPEGQEAEVEWLTSNEVLFPRSHFALVHWDDVAMVFLDRRPEHRALIAAYEYRVVRPEDLDGTVADAQDPTRRLAILEELRRKLQEDSGSRRALELVRRLQE